MYPATGNLLRPGSQWPVPGAQREIEEGLQAPKFPTTPPRTLSTFSISQPHLPTLDGC